MSDKDRTENQHPLLKRAKTGSNPLWLNTTLVPDHALNHRAKTLRYLVKDTFNPEAQAIAYQIDACGKQKCRSPFCPRCRQEIQENAAEKALQFFGSTPVENLRFLTILLPVSPPSPVLVREQIADCRTRLRSLLDYHEHKDVKLFGAFEVDVKTRRLSLTSPRGKEVLSSLGMDIIGPLDEPFYLPHLHAIIDIKDHDEDRLKKCLKKQVFNLPYQVRMTNLLSGKSKARNLKNLAHYMFKFRAQYADNLYGSGTGLKARYGSFYPPEILQPYVVLVHGLMNGNKVNGLEMRYGLNRGKDGG